MSCGCTPPTKTPLWTPIPVSSQPTSITFGEHIDCYARRSEGVGPKDDLTQDVANKIQQTALYMDRDNKVDQTFTLSTGPRTATTWSISPAIPGLTINPSTGKLSGTIDSSVIGQTFTPTITASDASGPIDARKFTLVTAAPTKGDSLSLIVPYVPASGGAKISSGFGPRNSPTPGGSTNHNGQDWVAADPSAKGKGTIVAAADGEVIFAGPANGYGNLIRIRHTSATGEVLAETVYGHSSKILVTKGQKVTAGQTIAKEGSTGVSSGPHLHFGVYLGGKTPVDPNPYYGAAVQIQPPKQADGTTPPPKIIPGGGKAITKTEVAARTGGSCEKVLGSTPTTSEPANAPNPSPTYDNKSKTTTENTPAVRPAYTSVNDAITRALNESDLTEEDKKSIRFTAQIESRFDPYAKNPNSSATGLYQMTDKTADAYYRKIGVEPTLANRTDPYYATKAQIAFYKDQEKYWNNYVASGKTTIAGKQIVDTPHSQRYATLTKNEFIYGLIHHDGVGNAVQGVDKQGVDYYRKKIRETPA